MNNQAKKGKKRAPSFRSQLRRVVKKDPRELAAAVEELNKLRHEAAECERRIEDLKAGCDLKLLSELVAKDPLQFKVASGVILMGGCGKGARRHLTAGRDWYRAFLDATPEDRQWLVYELDLDPGLDVNLPAKDLKKAISAAKLTRAVSAHIKAQIDPDEGAFSGEDILNDIIEFEGLK